MSYEQKDFNRKIKQDATWEECIQALARIAPPSVDRAVGLQKQAYWHVVDISFLFLGSIETKTMDDIINWARLEKKRRANHGIEQMKQRLSVKSPAPDEPEDVKDDQLLLLLEHIPHLILEVGQHLTTTEGREIAALVKSTSSLNGKAVDDIFYSRAVEWAEKIRRAQADFPSPVYSVPKWDGALPGGRLGRLRSLAEGMMQEVVGQLSMFIIQLDAFLELCHNPPPAALMPKDKIRIKLARWKVGVLEQKLELEDSLVDWAQRWCNVISEEDYAVDVCRDLLRFR